MAKELADTIFTEKDCKNCKRGIWERINYDSATSNNTKILNEKHEVYFCSAECDIPGYKTEIYKL